VTYLTQTTQIMALLICLIALTGGSGRERIGAFVVAILSALTLAFPVTGLLSIGAGLAGLIGFVALCWKASHPWPLWAAATQSLVVMVSVLRLTHPQITAATADTIQRACLYALLFSLLTGTLYAARQRPIASTKDNGLNKG